MFNNKCLRWCSWKCSQQSIGSSWQDTDWLILLLFYFDLDSNDFYFKSMRTSSTTMKICKTTSTFRLDACHRMPFVQAISGCDTTFSMFGMDPPLFKILKEIRLRKHAMMFMNPNASQDEIVKSGEEVIVSLYGGIIYEGLNFLRYRKFTRKVSACPYIRNSKLQL